ncbi:MAG: hypothetical protein CMB75_01240 [Euryarchaeota archaeon]|nr:hypothetical protein [Euryarchaeota archaeon]|tara:strand:- start:5075 stop:5899 length:825 start_codon:yes stop_codon:yes gene_type:complete
MAKKPSSSDSGTRKALIPIALPSDVARPSPIQRIRKWWRDNPDIHYSVTAYTSILFAGAAGWGLLFLMLGGATDPATSSLVPFSWTCLILGGAGCFFLLPEFFAYLSLRDTFEEICALESRTEVIRRRKEAEDAAEALGAMYRSRLLGVYLDLEIKPNRRWRERPKNGAQPISWWSNPRSKISVILPGLDALRKVEIHRALISLTSFLLAIIMFESIFGGFDGSSGSLNDIIIGSSVENHTPPYIDSVSAVIALALSMLLWMTTPAKSIEEDVE